VNHSVEGLSTGPTIFEIAAAAGVSITTVSHVFSGKRRVGEDTRRRVIEVAERLAYRPRRNARSLATGRTMTLAVQFPMSGPEMVLNPYFTALLPAMSEAAVGLGYAFALVPPSPGKSPLVDTLVLQRRVDAAILLDPRRGDRFPKALVKAGIPMVSLGRLPDVPGCPRVDQDFEAAIRGILEHLTLEGYSRFAFLTIPDDLSSIVDIRDSFERLAHDSLVAVADDFSDHAAAAAVQRLLKRRPRPDAIICLTERQAVGAYRAAAEANLSIPADLGVISLGESPISRGLTPPATSLSVFPENAGRSLVTVIAAMLEGKAVPDVTLVPTELLPRDSTRRRIRRK
jgi:DNA-binding LacI/PurR family transcriptional regulator